MIAEISDKVEN